MKMDKSDQIKIGLERSNVLFEINILEITLSYRSEFLYTKHQGPRVNYAITTTTTNTNTSINNSNRNNTASVKKV